MRNRIESIVSGVAATLLFLLMFVTLVDVLGRYLFNSPLLGATELTEVFLVSITFLLYPVVALHEKHIVVDLIDHWSNPVLRAFQAVVTALIGALLFGIVAWRLWILGWRSVEYRDITPGLGLHIGWVFLFVAILSGVTALVYLYMLSRVGRARSAAVAQTGFEGELI